MIKYKKWTINNSFSKVESLDNDSIVYTNLKDKRNIPIWEGDFRLLNGKVYKLENNGWCFIFWRYNESILLTEDTGYISEYIGNIFENKNYLNLLNE